MSRSGLAPLVVGVDVGGPAKGFHAVALCERDIAGICVSPSASEVAAWCRALDATVVAIDAPCRWSRRGGGRPCESALVSEGIRLFATPRRAVGERHPFYRWMCRGRELYRLLAPRFRLFDGRRSPRRRVCFETFPQAVACALAKRRLPASRKRIDRVRLLRRAGLSVRSLATIDLVDAALCALAAQHFLAGTFTTYGDAREGFIVLPKIKRRQDRHVLLALRGSWLDRDLNGRNGRERRVSPHRCGQSRRPDLRVPTDRPGPRPS